MSNKHPTGRKPLQYTPAQVIEALEKAQGLVSYAATRLKPRCSPQTIYEYCKRFPEVEAARQQAKETMIDVAELSLYNKVKIGEGWAVCFYLKTQGKARGYVERQEVTGKDGEELFSLTALRELITTHHPER